MELALSFFYPSSLITLQLVGVSVSRLPGSQEKNVCVSVCACVCVFKGHDQIRRRWIQHFPDATWAECCIIQQPHGAALPSYR